MGIRLYLLIIVTLIVSNTCFPTTIFAQGLLAESTLVEQKSLQFIVYHNEDINTVMEADDAALKKLMFIYNMELIKQFEIDELHRGFVLETQDNIDMPYEVAKEMSMGYYILMVEVELPDHSPNRLKN